MKKRKKGKTIVTELVIPQKITDMLNAKPNCKYIGISALSKKSLIKKYAGFCSVCGQIATHKIEYKLSGASIIERFCDKHKVFK